jgi:hypothetical protein
MFDFVIKTDADKFLNKLEKELPKNVKIAINETTIKGFRVAVENTPKRTGIGRKTWRKVLKNNSGIIQTNSIPLVSLENGRKATTITPKRSKILVFAIDKKAQQVNTFQIKKSSKDKFFKIVGKLGIKKASEKTGITIARKVNQPARTGTHFVQNKIVPVIQNIFNEIMSRKVDEIL